MFSSKSKDAPQSSATSSAPMAPPPPAKRPARSSAPSIISADLVVTGTLTSTGDIQIDGRVEGDVHSAGLVIGDKAVIHGQIYGEDVTVRGHVQGGIRAKKVQLCSTCHVEGDILHEAFAVEAGAFFEGNCRHSDNPLSDGVSGRKPAEVKHAPTPVAQPTQVVTRPAEAPRAAAATLTPLKAGA